MARRTRDHLLSELISVAPRPRARDLLRDEVIIELEAVPEGAEVGAIAVIEGARVLALLAAPGTARAELYHVMARRSVDPCFPREVRQETEALLASPGLDDPALEDLRHLPFVTIDNADSRDLDQALHIERQDEGGYVVFYALADAAFYVRPGTALFDEALERGASYYLPGVMSPMLPASLSEGLVSLNPQVDRRALMFTIRLDEQGRVQGTTLSRALIHSRAKLTYHGVQRLHDAPCTSALTEQPYTPGLMLLGEVGQKRIALSERRDVVPFNRVSASVGLEGEGGARFVARLERRNQVERWNEQISLLCNMEGARFLSTAASHVQAVYRVHPEPRAEDLLALSERIDALVDALGLPEVWRWGYNPDGAHTTLARYIEALPTGPDHDRLRQAIERQALVMLSASSFTDAPGPHYGIGADSYSRFSSPMREIVGIFTHKEALEQLHPETASDNAADEALREAVIAAGNQARSLQRTLTKDGHRLALGAIMDADLAQPLDARPWREGTLMGVSATRLYIQLDDPPMDIKVYHDHLAIADGAPPVVRKDRVSATRATGQVVSVGDRVQVRVVGCEPGEAGRYHLALRGPEV